MSQALPQQIEFAYRMAARMERLSADSGWAHRASGLRGALLRWLEAYENSPSIEPGALQQLDRLVERALEILTLAAREIREPDDGLGGRGEVTAAHTPPGTAGM